MQDAPLPIRTLETCTATSNCVWHGSLTQLFGLLITSGKPGYSGGMSRLARRRHSRDLLVCRDSIHLLTEQVMQFGV